MLLELLVLGLVAYVLLSWHRQELAKGNEGLGAAGPILEELETLVFKILAVFRKQASLATGRKAPVRPVSLRSESEEAMTQSNSSPAGMVPMEKFESVRQPKERSRSKHHSKHRSKMDSALKAALK